MDPFLFIGVMVSMNTEELLVKMYEELKTIKEEIEEIKKAIIPEDDPTMEELKEIEEGNREISEGKHRSWKDVREDLG